MEQEKTKQQIAAERHVEMKKKFGSGEMTLENMIETMFIVKNLDDLFLAEQAVLQQLKTNRFQPVFLERRDKIQHDIAVLQPLVGAMGMRFARHIEKKYALQFRFLNGGVSDNAGQSEFDKTMTATAEGKKETPSIVLTSEKG